MSRDFIDAIENGDNIEAESEFSNVMMSKVGNELEAHRQELANEFVNEKLVTELTPDQKKAREMSRGPKVECTVALLVELDKAVPNPAINEQRPYVR